MSIIFNYFFSTSLFCSQHRIMRIPLGHGSTGTGTTTSTHRTSSTQPNMLSRLARFEPPHIPNQIQKYQNIAIHDLVSVLRMCLVRFCVVVCVLNPKLQNESIPLSPQIIIFSISMACPPTMDSGLLIADNYQ